MPPTFTFPELNSEQGTATADGLRNVANTAANAVCNLWENYSEFTSSFADPLGVGKFNNALFSSLCAPRGKNPSSPPGLPFNGGQCPILYRIDWSITYGPNDLPASNTFFNVQGPVSGPGYGGAPPSGQISFGAKFAPTSGNPLGFAAFVTGTPGSVNPVKVNSFTVTPMSGPDNCGNPPPSYPIITPPSSATNFTTNVNIGAGVVINAPVTIIPTLFQANALFRPQIQVGVGPFNVTFDAGGVTINPSFDIGGGGKTVPDPNAYQPPTPPTKPPSQTGGDCDLTPVITKLDSVTTKVDTIKALSDDIKECSCPVGYTVSVSNIGSGNSGEVPLASRAIQVRLTLTTIPANPKTIQNGGQNAPLQYFCGYYSFGDGNGLGARTAINVASSVFEVPMWATSFSWSLYAGYEAIVSMVTLVPEKAGAELAGRQLKMPPS